jgi:hypothetical protein
MARAVAAMRRSAKARYSTCTVRSTRWYRVAAQAIRAPGWVSRWSMADSNCGGLILLLARGQSGSAMARAAMFSSSALAA